MFEVNIPEVIGINNESFKRVEVVEITINKPTILVLKVFRRFSCFYDVLKDYLATIVYVRNGKISQKIKLQNGQKITIRATKDQSTTSLPLNFRSLGEITHMELETEAEFDDSLINPYRNGERSSMLKNVYDFVPLHIINKLINKYGFSNIER